MNGGHPTGSPTLHLLLELCPGLLEHPSHLGGVPGTRASPGSARLHSVQRLPAPRPWAVEGAAEARGGRGRCCCGCEASIISLLAGVPFLVLFFLAAEEPGYFRSPQSSRWEQPLAAGRGRGGGGQGYVLSCRPW